MGRWSVIEALILRRGGRLRAGCAVADADLKLWEAFMPYVDDIKSGRITTAVAWTILAVAVVATAVVVVFLAGAQ